MTVSLSTGYDTGYLTKAVGTGADYYLGVKGEPPGYWQGAGAAALGLVGQVDAEVMRRLYHEDIGPDGQVLGRRQRKATYPVAGRNSMYDRIEAEVARVKAERGRFMTPEDERALRLSLRSAYRTIVPFYDYTFSAPKSVSVLWASLLAAAAEAEAGGRGADAERLAERAAQVRGAVKRANDRMIAVAERELAYVRTGHHSKTSGEWRDAGGFIVASFEQHDSRDGEMQLHVHNAIANRAQRADGADDLWRALHGHPLFRNKLRMGTLAERFLAQELELIGFLGVLREDGMAIEVGGISDDAMDQFSTRSKDLRAATRELVAQYVRDHGHAPGKRAMWAIKQQANKDTREAKKHNPPRVGEQVAGWARKAERSGIGALSALHEAAEAYSAEHEPGRPPSAAERARIIRKAVAAVQLVNATWDRSQLTFELGQVLPPLPAGIDPEEYLNGLGDEAVSGRAEGVNVLQIAPAAELIDVTRLGLRKDDTSVYRPPGEERFCTAEHADREKYLVDVAVLPVRPRMTAEAAAAAVAGTDLDYSQREACAGLLASRQLINCLVAPAGTGKTHVMAAFARSWTAETGGRVIGLTASTNAARVMAEEAAQVGAQMETANIAQFLGKIKDSDQTRGHMPVYPGDVLVVDEATQVSTEDVLRIVQVARRSGAMVVGTFDPAQLGAVDAGGIFPLIAARHGSYELTEVRRFRHAWEWDASLRLRDGDVAALAEYAGRGRIYHGPQDQVSEDAVLLYLNGFLSGQESLLMATSNETAARLSALVRERLVELGRVSAEGEVTLADGNQAGRGDLVRARLNTRIDADGQTLANRDTIRLQGLVDAKDGPLAVVARQTGPGEWSRAFFVPVTYLQESAELAYAGNVHVAQGRTVDRGHLMVDAGANRNLVYTGATRGREKNTIHVVTGPPDPAQPTRAERDAYATAQLHQAAALRRAGRPDLAREVRLRMPDRPSDLQLAPWEAVLAQVLQQDEPERTALEEIQAAQDYVTNTGHLLALSEAFWQVDVVPKIDEMVRQRITPAEYERFLQDPERPAFLDVLREHEIGGRRIEDVLDAITAEPLTGLRSIAAGLHGRAGKEPAPVRGQTTRWAERLSRDASPEITAAGQMMDTRQAFLGEQLAAGAPHWALEAWGVPPAEPGALRDDWVRRAAVVQSYRDAAGITDPSQVIGPAPSGTPQMREAFRAAVTALALPDDAALLKAMGRGELEAVVDEHDRAAALAPWDVQADIHQREAQWEDARVRAHIAGGNQDAQAQAQAEAQVEDAAADLTSLAVADAARREWIEAHAGLAADAEAAERELRSRGLPERIPVTDAEVAEAETEPRETPAMDPAEWARLKAEQTARLEAERQARAEEAERAVPVTEAEVAAAETERLEFPVINPAQAAIWEAENAARAEAERQARRGASADVVPVTDAEVAKTEAEPRPFPEIDPADVARWRAEHAARNEAERQARAGQAGRQVPVTDAEVAAAEAEPLEFPQVDPAQAAIWEAERAVRDEAERQARAGEMSRRYPVTDAEMTVSEATGRPAESPLIDPADADRWRAEQTALNEADRQARKEASARAYPVTDAEIAKYGPPPDLKPAPEPEPEAEAEVAEAQERDEIKVQRSDAEWRLDNARRDAEAEAEFRKAREAADARSAALEDIHAEIGGIGAEVNRTAEADARRDAERRAEMDQAGIDEPVVHEPRAEPSLEASPQPADAHSYSEPEPEVEPEPEIEPELEPELELEI